jgi:tetratricopeptide (TPR) repeat protein
MKYSLLLGCTVALVAFADVAVAKTAAEVESIAKAVTVEIKLQQNGGVGSGVIVDHQGDLYTLVTNNHVVCGNQRCSELPTGENYSLGLVDGQQYRVKTSSIRLLGNDLDLAIIQFRSSRKYSVAQVSASDSLKVDDVLYTAGFPYEIPGFSFNEGEAIAVVNKRLIGDAGGYSIIYDAYTLPGMSGGGVFDSKGQLVAIHGRGDKYTSGTEINNDDVTVNAKIGFNRGIPVSWLVKSSRELGINLVTQGSTSDIRAARLVVPNTADEYFITGFNKYVEPGDDVLAGKQQAIQEFSIAIKINPKYSRAYFMRGYAYLQLQNFQQALVDWNKAIYLSPKYAAFFYNRGILKNENLNDFPGALSDFDQAIFINPKYAKAYNNRGILKEEKFNDVPGALADYNKAISLNPKNAKAYYNRGVLKDEKLNDFSGALSDFNQAIFINPKYAKAYNNRGNLKYKLNDLSGALSDYNQAILYDPKSAESYYNRGTLKGEKLNDMPAALSDYNQAILLNPKHAKAYGNRGILKYQLNDFPGALSDYNQAIILNPKLAVAYNNRGILKAYKLNDRAGGIQDFRQAARIFREEGKTQYLQFAIEQLRKLGATE